MISYPTTDWEFGPHSILLRKAIKEGVVGRGRPTKSVETRNKALGFKEELRNENSSCRKWIAGSRYKMINEAAE
jgi:hypothetical protein